MIAPRAPPASAAEGEQVTVRAAGVATQSNAASECPGVAVRGSRVATAVGWLSEQAAARAMAPSAASAEIRAGVSTPAGTRGIGSPGWMDGRGRRLRGARARPSRLESGLGYGCLSRWFPAPGGSEAGVEAGLPRGFREDVPW